MNNNRQNTSKEEYKKGRIPTEDKKVKIAGGQGSKKRNHKEGIAIQEKDSCTGLL